MAAGSKCSASYFLVSTFCVGIVVAGVLLAVFSDAIAKYVTDQVPNYISDEIRGVTMWFDDGLIIFGSVIGAIGVWGCVAFSFKIRWMVIVYLCLLALFYVIQTCGGLFFLINWGSSKFIILDGTINGQFESAMNPYCDTLPIDATDYDTVQTFVPGLEIEIEGTSETVPVSDISEAQWNTYVQTVGADQVQADARAEYDAAAAEDGGVVAGELERIQNEYVQPLIDIGITECQVPHPFDEQGVCRNNYQYPCQEGVVIWFNGKLFWLGVILLGVAAFELLVFVFGIKFYRDIARMYAARKVKKNDPYASKKNVMAKANLSPPKKGSKGKVRRRSVPLAGEGPGFDDDQVFEGEVLDYYSPSANANHV